MIKTIRCLLSLVFAVGLALFPELVSASANMDTSSNWGDILDLQNYRHLAVEGSLVNTSKLPQQVSVSFSFPNSREQRFSLDPARIGQGWASGTYSAEELRIVYQYAGGSHTLEELLAIPSFS